MEHSLYAILWYFLIYAFLGWCLEVVFCTLRTGRWVNRGFLNGPVCPIYGFGMVIVLMALEPLADRPLALFVGSALLTSALELVTGWALKTLFHTTWWDYSKQKFNLGGYICLKFSLAWGLVGMLAVKVLHPPVNRFVEWMPRPVGLALLVLWMAVFVADVAVTLRTLIGLERDLGELEKVVAALRRGSDTISRNLGDAALAADARILDTRLFGAARLMKAFPAMKDLRHSELLAELKKTLHERLHR